MVAVGFGVARGGGEREVEGKEVKGREVKGREVKASARQGRWKVAWQAGEVQRRKERWFCVAALAREARRL